MPGKVLIIETARINRLPQVKEEVWEVGRRQLDLSVAELQRRGEQPDLLLAVQANGQAGVIQANIVPCSAPQPVLADFVLEAMRQPMIGMPRRPQLVRVSSSIEAEALTDRLSAVRVRLQVCPMLSVLDALMQQIGIAFGGIAGDYRTNARRAGEPLSDDALRGLFHAARDFYRAELWLDFDDEVMFEIELQPAHEAPITLYVVILGNMGQEFGLALYTSLDELQRFYEFSLQHIDQLDSREQPIKTVGKGDSTRKRQRQEATLLSELSSVSAVGLTFTPQRDMPASFVEEAKRLRLPLANKSAFPLIMRLGAGGMTIASTDDLRHVYAAMRAILDWDRQLSTMTIADDLGIIINSKLPAVADFLPDMTARTTLRLNPFLPEQELPSSLDDFFNVLFETLPERPSSSQRKSSKKGSGTTKPKAAKKAQAKPSTPRIPRPSRTTVDKDNA